jgi:hypothetical protein
MSVRNQSNTVEIFGDQFLKLEQRKNFRSCTYHALTKAFSITSDFAKPLILLVGGAGFEPATPGV